jgi:hypothetical protein
VTKQWNFHRLFSYYHVLEVLTFPFTRTKINVSSCRRACRSVNVNFAVLYSTISSLFQSDLWALCGILISCSSTNFGGSISISFDVRKQELELMIEYVQFLIVGSLPCFRLSRLSMAPHKVVQHSFSLLHQFLWWNKRVNFSTYFSGTWPQGWILEIWNFILSFTESSSRYSAGNMRSHLECLATSLNARTKQRNVVEK